MSDDYTAGVRNAEFQRKIYSVSEAQRRDPRPAGAPIHRYLGGGGDLEFQGIRRGTLYFTLKDDRAQLSAVCFRTLRGSLRFRPENGKALWHAGA
jgi:hypothetical protein